MTDNTIAELPIWQDFGFKPHANREPDNLHKVKGVGYHTENLEVCSLSLAALHFTVPSFSITPTDRMKLQKIMHVMMKQSSD